MPAHASRPGVAAHPGTPCRSVFEGASPRCFIRARRHLRLVPDLSAYDPAEDRIREQLLAMGVAMGGRS
ncbi:hypothetical protein AB0K02_23550 [Streptomyces sp. NPDC049597]|uniref:hypothetical protein n=1 Tax=Streptomyces sp. NPDC049597 TaxID=3155276 RepID=UPI0034483842